MDLSPEETIRKRIKNLKVLAIILFVASIGFFYSDYTKDKFTDKNDLRYITGPFGSYSWTRTLKNSNFTFQLENYSDFFMLNSDFIRVLKFGKFKQIQKGEIVTVGILPSDQKYLNTEHYPIFVYSIEDNQQVYFSVNDTIKLYNRPLLKLFSLTLLMCSVICFVQYYKMNKFYS